LPLFSAAHGILQPEAFAVGFEDMNPVGQSIQQRPCQALGA
jgi:hypothetical protein